jgi:hypothetical protein
MEYKKCIANILYSKLIERTTGFSIIHGFLIVSFPIFMMYMSFALAESTTCIDV